MSIKPLLLSIPLFTACITDPELDVTVDEIDGPNAQAASQFQVDRAIRVPGCTATKISARWALTAASCQPQVDGDVNFYTAASGINTTESGVIAQVVFPPGISLGECSPPFGCYSSGKYADLALIKLKSGPLYFDENDLDGHHGALQLAYPGSGANGVKVGSGMHPGPLNTTFALKQHADTTSSYSDNDGKFLTIFDHANTGDRGGPFYYQNRILGVMSDSLDQDIYTSVPEHLGWILNTIGYTWLGQPPQSNMRYIGSSIATHQSVDEQRCQYACESEVGCEGYSFNTATNACTVWDHITTIATESGWKSGFRTRQGNSNGIVGYVRSDGRNAVVHVANDGHIHELVLDDGEWDANDLHSASLNGTPPLVYRGGGISAYRRHDGINAVVYRSTTNRIIELALEPGVGWEHQDLTTAANAEPASSSVTAYVKADGVSAVVYRGATTNSIIELRLGSRGWVKLNLTAAAGSTAQAASPPSAFVRSDGHSSVVFRTTDGSLRELFQAVGGNWDFGSPSLLAVSPPATGRPFGFTQSNGKPTIVYRSTTNEVIQLTLNFDGWVWKTLGASAGGDPTAYVRTDLKAAVVYRDAWNQIIEVTDGWNLNNLHVAANASALAGTNPAVFVRNDRHNEVLFEAASDDHVHELFWKVGQAAWGKSDLTAITGETP